MLENQEAVTGNLIAVIDWPAVGQSYRRTAFHARILKLMCAKMLAFLALYLERAGSRDTWFPICFGWVHLLHFNLMKV